MEKSTSRMGGFFVANMAERRIIFGQNEIYIDGMLLREQRGLSGLITRREVPTVGGGRRYRGDRALLQALGNQDAPVTDRHIHGPQWNENMTKDDIRGF